MKIGVVSDTHVPNRARSLPAALLEGLAGVDLILHAGDLLVDEVLGELEAVAPVQAVRGNCDPAGLWPRLPERRLLALAGLRVGLIHGHAGTGASTAEKALAAFPQADAVVFGHSHRPLCERRGQVLLFNPGSPTDPRGMPRPSFGLLTLGQGRVWGEVVFL